MPDYRMTFAEWQSFDLPMNEWIIGGGRFGDLNRDDQRPFRTVLHPYGFNAANGNRIFRTPMIASQKDILCLAAFSPSTHASRRPVLDSLDRFACVTKLPPRPFDEYFDALRRSKFIISPQGNETDTHRTYEALMAKAVPVLQRDSLIAEKYDGLPILWTSSDYQEDIDEPRLTKSWDEFQSRTFDFARLTQSYWLPRSPNMVKNCKFWWSFHNRDAREHGQIWARRELGHFFCSDSEYRAGVFPMSWSRCLEGVWGSLRRLAGR